MKIIYNKILPFGSYDAITLFGFVFAKKKLTPTEINHEAIHLKQGREMLWIFFYLWYGIEWFVRLMQYSNTKNAYYNISFEREAYANQYNLEYLNSRKWYSWIKYIKV